MTSRPWQPPGLLRLESLGVTLQLPAGALLEAQVQWSPSHRVIASEFAGENIFDRLTSDVDYARVREEVDLLREIADLTNPHVLHESGQFEVVRQDDRIFGRGSGLIMASFAFPGQASRFSDGSYGVYYAARDLDTAITETRFHAQRYLRGSGPCVLEKTVVQAELDGVLVDVRSPCPCPAGVYDPFDYRTGNDFGSVVKSLDGHGIVYDSVRRVRGECVAVFRPPVLRNAVATQTLEYEWDGVGIVAVR